MYAIGQKYDLPHLQELALDTYIKYTIISRNAMADVRSPANAILSTVPFIYTSTLASDRRLKDLVADTVLVHIDAFTTTANNTLSLYQKTLWKNSGFSLDVFHRWIAARREVRDQEQGGEEHVDTVG